MFHLQGIVIVRLASLLKGWDLFKEEEDELL